MIDLKYDTIAQVIAVSRIGDSSHAGLVSKYTVNTGDVELGIRFSEYVKSQVHLNVVHGLYGRPLSEYAETLWFLQGMTSKQSVAEKVLRYYYADMANFLINNETAINLKVSVDTEYFDLPKISVCVADEAAKMMAQFDDAVKSQQLPEDWEFVDVYERARDTDEFREKALNFALSNKLLQCSHSDELVLLESI